MADIFLSYAREDREKAERLAKALEGQGWSVFWDLTIPAGESWDTYIGGELEKARCIVVAWSKKAVASEWVREEAGEGKDRDVLIPVLFERVKPPFGFGRRQAVDLSTWAGTPRTPAFEALTKGVERVLRPDRLNRRILIEGGEFLMGSPEGVGALDERPQHRVRLSAFHLQEHPVTNEEYRRSQPDHHFPAGMEQHPVVSVTWQDARDYAKWLGGRLPTEAEWEYACRAGTDTKYWSGDSKEDLAGVGWYAGNSGHFTHPVGQKPPNPWGLYDMHGNVWEWVADWYGKYSQEPQDDPKATPVRRVSRVIRGGGFGVDAGSACSASRGRDSPGNVSDNVGFRVAFDAPRSKGE